ncbi:alpha-crystallin B chain-like [Galleria mellonella]|uniref:Alpha-crystallin B chain-like n=1 Tax=Galleria mellonella TaxID=7137 RepID=A0A6J1WJT2_GALME|nr:alpha-crystallin B chain-like [Galleria mellonella]
MIKYVVLIFGVISVASSNELRRHRFRDSLEELDRYISHALSHHYLWPWSQIVRTAAAIDSEVNFEGSRIISNDKKFEINLNVKRFKPDELNVTVNKHNIVVKGNHKVSDDEGQIFIKNRMFQRFDLPLECKPEEVKAVLNENGILSIWAPKHKLPPPPPERQVPIEVRLPVEKTENPVDIIEEVSTEKYEAELVKNKTNKKKETLLEKVDPAKLSTESPIWQQEDTTTHIGKIRKKELKTTTKTVKENEVTKGGEGNGLDYLLVDGEVEE